MTAMIPPRDVREIVEAVSAAAQFAQTLEIIGSGSRRSLGRPMAAVAVLDVSAIAGITLYEPEELVLTARAATPLDEIKNTLAQAGQQLAFEPPDLSALWNLPPHGGTLGGCLAVGWGGSRRPYAGSARDHFLGLQAVNGLGRQYAAGGRVVKNVTGFDLPKLLAGSFGTLGVLTEVTIKVLPAPQLTVLAQLPPCQVAMEACGGAVAALADGSNERQEFVRYLDICSVAERS